MYEYHKHTATQDNVSRQELWQNNFVVQLRRLLLLFWEEYKAIPYFVYGGEQLAI